MSEPNLTLIGNKYKKELIEQYNKQYAFYMQTIKDNALDNLWVWNRFVLKIEENGQDLAPFHEELCYFVEDNKKKKKLILLPRGHLKSTLVTIGYATQQIVKNPNIRILILSATWQMAVDFLTEIKRNLTTNEVLLELWGDLVGDKQAIEWAQDRITLPRSATNIKGPTVWAAGIESNLVGSHPDMIIFDDVVSRDNVQSQELIEKIILRYKDALDLLEPGGQFLVIGTRWKDGDFYDWIMDRDHGIIQSYDVMIKRAYTGELETGNNFKALWPEKFSLKELQTRQKEKGWYEFSSQYLNLPVSDEAADFKREWFKYYDVEEYRAVKMQSVMSLDPAISLKKDADYSAIGVFAIDQFTNIFVKDLARGHWKPSQIIDVIFYLYELYHPGIIVIETTAYQKALAYALNDEMRKRNRYLPIYEKNYQEKSKVGRIRALQPLYMNKKVYHRKELKLMPYFEEELTRFPRGKNDDMIDCFSIALDYLIPPQKKQTRYHHHYLY